MTAPRGTDAGSSPDDTTALTRPEASAPVGQDTPARPDTPTRSDSTARSETPSPETPSPETPRRESRPATSEQASAQRPETPPAVPRAGGGSTSTPEGPGWQGSAVSEESPTARTTVLPTAGAGRPAARPQRSTRNEARPAAGIRPLTGRTRRARLSLRRIDPWSVFLFSLVASVFLGIALIVAVAVLYAVLGSLGVTDSVNQLFAEVTGGDLAGGALLTSGRIVGGAAVLAAVNVVFLTLLATLASLLYNLCASFTGGLELTFGERD